LQEDDQAALSADGKGARERGLRGAQLWVGLARAALSADAMAADDGPAPATEPSLIAKAIDERQNNAAYDQVIVGYLLQIADELKHTGGSEAAALRRRTSKLVGALQPGTLRRLIEMGGDNAQRTKFAIDATHGLAVDAVLEIVRAMADASHKTVSEPLVRMLSKLAQHAEQGTVEVRPQADEALREQVRDLLQGWTLADPNPDAYSQALQKMSAAAPFHAARSEWQQSAEPLRIVQTALETGVLGSARGARSSGWSPSATLETWSTCSRSRRLRPTSARCGRASPPRCGPRARQRRTAGLHDPGSRAAAAARRRLRAVARRSRRIGVSHDSPRVARSSRSARRESSVPSSRPASQATSLVRHAQSAAHPGRPAGAAGRVPGRRVHRA